MTFLTSRVWITLVVFLQATVTAGGDPLYAELEHDKKKKSIVIAPDNTGVQYSEIKTEEVMLRVITDISSWNLA